MGCCRRGYVLIARPAPGVALVHHEIELPPRRRVDFENLEHAAAQIGKGMGHAGGNVHHVVLADDVGLFVHGQRALAALDDIDVVGLGVVMALAARPPRHQPVEMDVDFLGAETGIDQLDLLAPSGLHRARRTFIQMQDFDHARSPHRPCPGNGPHAMSWGPEAATGIDSRAQPVKDDIMSRAAAIARAHSYFDSGEFLVDLRRRVAIPSTSQEPERAGALRRYLDDEMVPSLAPLGFTSRVLDNPSGPPFLVAERKEDDAAVTVLIYGHGDTGRGVGDLWRGGLSRGVLPVEGTRLYGRGTADNKGQHSVNIAALAAVIAERGRLGFNAKILIEMGEEVGSAGLREFCAEHKHKLLRADLLIASDGPRIAPDRPTLFLGARGGHPIDLVVDLREGAHHSANWGGLLANPGFILAHALVCITDAGGTIQVPEWRPPLPASVRRLLAGVEVDGGGNGPTIDRDWGEAELTPAERVFGWN